MNGQNTPVAENVSGPDAANAPVAASAAPVQAASAKLDTLVVYKIVNGERSGEEVVLVPSAGGTQYVTSTANESAAAPKHVRLEFEASGVVFTIVVLAFLAFLGYALSILRCIMLGRTTCRSVESADGDAPAARAAAQPVAPAAPVAAPAAAPVSTELHPGLSNEKLAVILGVAAAETLGPNVQVVKFRHMNQSDWTWAVQGRSHLHSNRLV